MTSTNIPIRQEWISKRAACERLGMGRRRLDRILADRELRHYRTPSGRFRISGQDLDRYQAEQADWLPTAQAAQILGIYPGTLLSWRKNGLIKVKGGHNGLYFHRDDLERIKKEQGSRNE